MTFGEIIMAVGRKKTLFYIIIVMLLIMVLILFLGNTSKHGFYSDVFDNEPDVDDWIKIGDESVDFIIKPQNQNFAGVVVYVKTEGKKTINADVYTEGSIYENICVDTNKSFTEGWVVLNLNRVYNEGEEYKVFIYGEKGEDIYVATGVKSEDLGNINNIIIGYGCKKQTFLFEEKMVMLLLGIVGLVYLGSELVENNSIKKKMRLLAFGMLFESVLVLSYLFNSFNENNRETFNNFQKDSDGLVICAIEEDGELEKSGYGLGYYTLDDNGEIIVEPYVSQYGLQGKVFSLLNALVSTDKSIRIARLICVVLTAMVMTVLIYLIYKRYDLLYAGCFGVVFLF